MSIRARPATVAAVAAHITLLAAYTLPQQFVPTRVRYWSQAYARVLFHQDWRLFAPDPPACGCTIEYDGSGSGTWRRLEDLRRHFIWRRMAANACRYAEATDPSSARAPEPLERSLGAMIGAECSDRCAIRIARTGGICDPPIVPVHWRPGTAR